MSNTSSNSSGGGIGFFGLLGVLFIGLKLGGVITWPWIWVTAPLWAGFALGIVFLILSLIFGVIFAAIAASRASATRTNRGFISAL